MAKPYTYQRRVEFRDTDMAGIVHFSVFFSYMEEAEHSFLRANGLSVVATCGDQKISWPRVSASCNYRRAIRFEQIISVEVSIERIGDKSVTYRFRFFESEQVIAEGTVVTVCCRIEHGSPPKSIEIPDEIREKLESLGSDSTGE